MAVTDTTNAGTMDAGTLAANEAGFTSAASVGTQTTPPTLASMPKLTKRTKIQAKDIILVNKAAFQFKRDGTVCAGTDIHGPNGSAFKAKRRAINSIVKSINNPKHTPDQIALALREASTNPDAR